MLPKIRLFIFICGSCLIHLGLFYALSFRSLPRVQTPIEIELKSRLSSDLHSQAATPGRKSSAPRAESRKTVSDFFKTSSSRPSAEAHPSEGPLPDDQPGRQLRPQAWGARRSVEQLLLLSSFLNNISHRIENNLDYKEQLVEKEIAGSVTIDFELSSSGVLTRMQARSQGPTELRGLVLGTLQKTFAHPLPLSQQVQGLSRIPVTLVVQFHLSHLREAVAKHEAFIEGNQIFLFKYMKKSARYDSTEHSQDDNLWTRIFGKPKPDLTDSWDFQRRTDALLRTCEIELDADICRKAGENLFALNRLPEARRVFERLCDDGDTKVCASLRQINELLKSVD